jgi:hypothetical protein
MKWARRTSGKKPPSTYPAKLVDEDPEQWLKGFLSWLLDEHSVSLLDTSIKDRHPKPAARSVIQEFENLPTPVVFCRGKCSDVFCLKEHWILGDIFYHYLSSGSCQTCRKPGGVLGSDQNHLSCEEPYQGSPFKLTSVPQVTNPRKYRPLLTVDTCTDVGCRQPHVGVDDVQFHVRSRAEMKKVAVFCRVCTRLTGVFRPFDVETLPSPSIFGLPSTWTVEAGEHFDCEHPFVKLRQVDLSQDAPAPKMKLEIERKEEGSLWDSLSSASRAELTGQWLFHGFTSLCIPRAGALVDELLKNAKGVYPDVDAFYGWFGEIDPSFWEGESPIDCPRLSEFVIHDKGEGAILEVFTIPEYDGSVAAECAHLKCLHNGSIKCGLCATLFSAPIEIKSDLPSGLNRPKHDCATKPFIIKDGLCFCPTCGLLSRKLRKEHGTLYAKDVVSPNLPLPLQPKPVQKPKKKKKGKQKTTHDDVVPPPGPPGHKFCHLSRHFIAPDDLKENSVHRVPSLSGRRQVCSDCVPPLEEVLIPLTPLAKSQFGQLCRRSRFGSPQWMRFASVRQNGTLGPQLTSIELALLKAPVPPPVLPPRSGSGPKPLNELEVEATDLKGAEKELGAVDVTLTSLAKKAKLLPKYFAEIKTLMKGGRKAAKKVWTKLIKEANPGGPFLWSPRSDKEKRNRAFADFFFQLRAFRRNVFGRFDIIALVGGRAKPRQASSSPPPKPASGLGLSNFSEIIALFRDLRTVFMP